MIVNDRIVSLASIIETRRCVKKLLKGFKIAKNCHTCLWCSSGQLQVAETNSGSIFAHIYKQMISAEAPLVFSKACELFVKELTLRAWIHTEDNKRRTLQVICPKCLVLDMCLFRVLIIDDQLRGTIAIFQGL